MPEALFQARNGVFAVVCCLALAVLGVSAHWVTLTSPDFFAFEAVGMVAGVLTLFVVGVFLAVGIFRKNATITIIGVELPTLVVLSAIFLAAGVMAGDFSNTLFRFGCSPFELNAFGLRVCKELNALKNLGFATFAIMTAYWLPLGVMVAIGFMQGHNSLKQSVREVAFSHHSQTQANALANGFMEQIGLKDHSHQHTAPVELTYEQQQQQQQQWQMQQLQLQQLQQQQAMLQQSYVQPEKDQV